MTSRPPLTLRAAVGAALARAWSSAAEAGALGANALTPDGTPGPSDLVVERPANPDHGDFASSVALRMAKRVSMPPRAVAEVLAAAAAGPQGAALDPLADSIVSAEVAGPGFVNLRLRDEALTAVVDRALADPAGWGRSAAGSGPRVNVEFVSANPTGPLTVGNARGAFVGDLLSRVLEAGGAGVTREYYFNDSGAQVRNLGASVLAIRAGTPIPDDGYHGDYVVELARELPAELAAGPAGDEAADWAAGHWASSRIRQGIEASLAHLGVHFDVWTTEGSLHADGWVDRAVERLRAGGHVYEQDGAVWFRSTDFGDDKDRVIRKSDGSATYFAGDIGYVAQKFDRGFDHLIYIWGIDHHGTVARVRNAAAAMGFDKSKVEMLLTGWVRFVRDGVELSMSKRAGTFITLDELLAELGTDAARWFFASRAANVDMDVDIELARRQSSENPVYYVQYAHARIASILRKATEAGIVRAGSVGPVIAGQAEGRLARVIARFPEVVEDAAAAHETQGVTTFATELATAFHAFYRDARVVDATEPERSAGRLALAEAARITLANALGLLGISAPDTM